MVAVHVRIRQRAGFVLAAVRCSDSELERGILGKQRRRKTACDTVLDKLDHFVQFSWH